MRRQETHLRQSYVFVFKVVVPFITLVFLGVIFWGDRGTQILLLVPALIFASIYLTAAQINLSANVIRYLLFTVWREIPYEQISKVGWSIFPGLGYVKLKTFLPPWGRLYFVVEERSHLRRELTGTMREIVKKAQESGSSSYDSVTENLRIEKERDGTVLWVALSTCGVLCGGVISWCNQPQLLSGIALSARAQHLRMLVHFISNINQPVWHLSIAVMLLIFLLYKRFQGVESLVAGFVMGGMAASLIRLWVAH